MHTCKRTNKNTYTHTYIHTHIHTYIHTHSYTRTCKHTYIHTCMHAYIHTYTHTFIHTYKHTYTHTCIHTFTRTCIQTCVRRHAVSNDKAVRQPGSSHLALEQDGHVTEDRNCPWNRSTIICGQGNVTGKRGVTECGRESIEREREGEGLGERKY